MEAVRRSLVSEAEFLSLPETQEKLELIDGEVIVTPAPSLLHQEILNRVNFALLTWARGQDRPVTIGLSPVDVRFAPGRILQPDLFVVLDEVSLETRGPLERIPEICIEILSSNRAHDRITKRYLYGEAGVQEYWVIDPAGAVEKWTGESLSSGVELEASLGSALLPGFELTFTELFRTSSSAAGKPASAEPNG